MKVFITGATGFVGSEILRQLIAAGHEARCLVRQGSEGKLPRLERVEVRHGDASEPETLAGALAGCDAVIHLVGIIREFPDKGITFQRLHVEATANVVAAAQAQGVKRYLHMSSNGTRADAVAAYHQTKWQAEEAVRASGLDWTIFRPSVIFGPGDGFVTMLADLVRRFPLVPVIGNGDYAMAPVAVGEVASGFVRALTKPETIGQVYHCCGPQALTYNQLLDAIGRVLGKSGVTKIHHPVFMVKPVVAMMEKMPSFPITSGQLTMLLEGNTCDPKPWSETFAIVPTSFEPGIRAYLK